MDNNDSNKRLKLANGSAIKKSPGKPGAAANLPAYRPPAAAGARGAHSPNATRPSASIARPANGKTSLRLTVKAAPSKLRQATSGSQLASIPPNPYVDPADESDAAPITVARSARSTRNPRTVVEPESEEEDEDAGEHDQEEVEEEDEDEEEEQVEDGEDEDQELEDAEEDSLEDAAGSEDEDEDEEMEDAEGEDEHPPPPNIKTTNPFGKTKPNVTVTAPPEGPLKSVEDKEMDEEEEDEELSELDSNENENDEDDDEEDSDSDEEGDESRAATPDLSKLTRRQRGAFINVEEDAEGQLQSLSNEALKKKELTAEEHAMRRAEMARRRKNLSEKRNEEEKMDTINKLLKKPAPKRRTRAEIIAAQQAEYMATPGAEEGEDERADPLFVRWVSNASGSRIGVPDEWMEMEGSLGETLRRGWTGNASGRMVEEVA